MARHAAEVNRRAFANRIADKTELFVVTVEQVLAAAIAAFREELVKVGRFEWRGLGTFVVRSYPARKIHNPKTRKTITLPARRSVGFKPSQKIRVLLASPRRGVTESMRTPGAKNTTALEKRKSVASTRRRKVRI